MFWNISPRKENRSWLNSVKALEGNPTTCTNGTQSSLLPMMNKYFFVVCPSSTASISLFHLFYQRKLFGYLKKQKQKNVQTLLPRNSYRYVLVAKATDWTQKARMSLKMRLRAKISLCQIYPKKH